MTVDFAPQFFALARECLSRMTRAIDEQRELIETLIMVGLDATIAEEMLDRFEVIQAALISDCAWFTSEIEALERPGELASDDLFQHCGDCTS